MTTTEAKKVQANTIVFSGKRSEDELAWFKSIAARRTSEKVKRLRAHHMELLSKNDIKLKLKLSTGNIKN